VNNNVKKIFKSAIALGKVNDYYEYFAYLAQDAPILAQDALVLAQDALVLAQDALVLAQNVFVCAHDKLV
jgi:hypothetical protein